VRKKGRIKVAYDGGVVDYAFPITDGNDKATCWSPQSQLYVGFELSDAAANTPNVAGCEVTCAQTKAADPVGAKGKRLRYLCLADGHDNPVIDSVDHPKYVPGVQELYQGHYTLETKVMNCSTSACLYSHASLLNDT
jgi:hypothetical protein